MAKRKLKQEDKDRFREFLGEGFHCAFRKATDCEQATPVWNLISAMPDDEWANVLDFVAGPLFEEIELILNKK